MLLVCQFYYFSLKINWFLPGIALEDCLNCSSEFHLSFLYLIASFVQAEMETLFIVQIKQKNNMVKLAHAYIIWQNINC